MYLGAIVNSHESHWVAIILDFHTHTIWHGDSLGWKMESKLKDTLEWWTFMYTSVHFTHNHLPITRQLDTFSCRLLAWNALCHFFFPELYPLIKSANVALE
jgi:hypothetical protein